MKRLTRRSVTAGLGAAVVASATVCALAAQSTPQERVKHLSRELEKAMLERYPGSKIVTLTGDVEPAAKGELNPYVLVVAQGAIPHGLR